MQALPQAGGLPAPWEAVKDPKTGFTYYHNTTTGVTSWDKPGASAAGFGGEFPPTTTYIYAPHPLHHPPKPVLPLARRC